MRRGLGLLLSALAIEAVRLRDKMVGACNVFVVLIHNVLAIEFTHDSKVVRIEMIEGGFPVAPFIIDNSITKVRNSQEEAKTVT